MRIERIEEVRLDHETEAEAAALIERCFGVDAGFGGRSYHGQRHHVRLLARDGGRIVGHMALTCRGIRLGDRLFDMLGLAEVCTAPERRGEGIAGALVAAALDEARASAAQVVLLFGVAKVYAAHGFRRVTNEVCWTEVGGVRSGDARSVRDDDLMVLVLDAGLEWDEDAPVDLAGGRF
ncbi:Probable acetyltransferase [Oceanicola granulosus HTCC2516]|uniref:Probable acetyltransferase n=1 Tax=Oceanicola granulosus (strain ATCC BAA-861 / DSM 15982 / KCTC 12143 / HTCC2516) TaxID=314256 RepID=Q2CDF4_OCEGH|nr:GNAT family N-acetyltransferase [Oceanicola granulosus]EAR50757.1 Probable acetyltransferase [Oceanicola granulosus HTCC2516]